MNLIQQFKKQLAAYLSRSTSDCDSLIKFNTSEDHDFGFQINLEIWKNYCKIENLEKYKNNILIYAANDETISESEAIDKLKVSSESWIFKIEKVYVDNKGICNLCLDRKSTFKIVLDLVQSDNYAKLTSESQSIYIKTQNIPLISQFRLITIEKVLKNLLKLSSFNLVDDASKAQQSFLLTTRSNFKADDNNRDFKTIVCGVVCDANKKISQMDTEKYLEKRTNDMHMIAIHKFGVRAKNDEEFCELTKKLGRAAATLDMIEVKHSSVLKLSSNANQAFILYNSARVETLIASFNTMVEEKYYPELPPLSDINLELLVEPLDWEMLKHLLLFFDVIEKSLGDILNSQIALHLLYKYLIGFINTFSVFYSRKKILLENRPHLINLVHAKIHLLKAIQKILNLVLSLFEIEPVKFM